MIWSRLGGKQTCGGQCQTDVPDPKLHNGPINGQKRRASSLDCTSLQSIFLICVVFEQPSRVALSGRMTQTRDLGDHP